MDARLLKVLQKAQKEYQKQIAELEDSEADFGYQNNAIVVTITGKLEIKNIKINPALIDPEDPITLQEMVAEAINNAISEVNKEKERIQSEVLGPYSGLMSGGLF